MEEETEYDEVLECDHSYDRRCHTSYSTTYTAQQEEECEDNYKKNCFIKYSPTAYNATVEICRYVYIQQFFLFTLTYYTVIKPIMFISQNQLLLH